MVAKKSGKSKRRSGKRSYWLAAGIAALLILHWIAVYADMHARDLIPANVIRWFDLDQEQNVPTAVSSLFLAMAAYWCVRLAGTAKQRLQQAGWLLFGLLFAYLALDEYLIIHEQAAEPLRKLLNILPGNPFFHAWVVPALGGLIILGIIIAVLKGYHRRFAVFSGVLRYLFFFVAGVIFLEVIGTFVFAHTSLYRFGMVPLEEVFELVMGGVLWLKIRDLFYTQT